MRDMTISELARLIKQDWKRVYFGAVPYLQAMGTMTSINDTFGCDPGNSVIMYFLANAQTWRGATAKAVKAELKRRLKEVL